MSTLLEYRLKDQDEIISYHFCQLFHFQCIIHLMPFSQVLLDWQFCCLRDLANRQPSQFIWARDWLLVGLACLTRGCVGQNNYSYFKTCGIRQACSSRPVWQVLLMFYFCQLVKHACLHLITKFTFFFCKIYSFFLNFRTDLHF